jgi:uncharacterized membrane protein HdeD (DUF308 family)/3',5'-cyclic AMP phosphodiesterase CpdA
MSAEQPRPSTTTDFLSDQEPRVRPDSPRWRNGLGLLVLLLAVLALLTPLSKIEVQGRVGLLLVLAAVTEVVHGFRRSTAAGQRAAWVGGGITFAMGVLLINAPYFAAGALVLFLAGWFGLDGIRYLLRAFRRQDRRRSAGLLALAGLGNLLIGAALLGVRGYPLAWTIAGAGALRIAGTASNIFLAPVFTAGDSGDTVAGDLALPDHLEIHDLARHIAAGESARAGIDRGWILVFMTTLLAIHLGRMGFDRTFLGLMSPAFATLGDVVLALILAFAVVVPSRVLWRRLTRGLERRAWKWCLLLPPERRGWARRVVQGALAGRLRAFVRLRQARYSARTALSRGLQIGLPLAAVIAATIPVWGMNWYFDTENWAAGIWNSWAEERTDTWREAMVRAVLAENPAPDPGRAFAVFPPGVSDGGDFSFLVIGDTGEGDASQHSLRSQFLEVVRREEVKFVVVSSDVVYPTGAMRDYEANFWLPFMGTTKPVYAIPGNHDWYDALEGFAATFLEPGAARAAMRARVEADNRITSTTDRHIHQLIAEAARLRAEYRVPTQLQKAPFFQIQTDDFALVAVDTGVARRIDPVQNEWLRAALASARGKITMAILGHPLYAGGRYMAEGNADFADLHALLQEHEVAIIMAGDTHDLEYYLERRAGAPAAHHVVNGGGGAYLSFGTALDWPARPASSDWAFHPNKAQVVAKIEATTPPWKWPAWWWTKRFGGWPFSAEWLSAAFDVNTAPFYQSFVEVRVEPRQRRVRLVPYGVHGRLRWRDLEASPGLIPTGRTADSLVEWIIDRPKLQWKGKPT